MQAITLKPYRKEKEAKRMPRWEEMKRAGQTAFISEDTGLQAAHASVDNFYRQIVTQGYISPSMESSDLTQQIAENFYEPTKEDWREYEQYLDQDQWPEQEPGIDMEPER